MAVLDTGGSTEGTAEAASVGDTFKLKEGTGIGLSINTGTDTVTISANIGIQLACKIAEAQAVKV